MVRRHAGDDVRRVLVIGGLDAPRRRRRTARPRPASGDAVPVEVTRATVIDAAPLGEPEAADAWLERATGPNAGTVMAEALALLNRAVAGHRLGAADPWLPDADPARALVCRVGYGTGEQVAEGDWEAARDVPRPAPRAARSLVLAPQERLAALLSGRDVAPACEELLLRARGDLEHGRPREAALQASIALAAALAELEAWRDAGDMAARIAELATHRDPVAAAAAAALRAAPDAADMAAVEAAVTRLEAALRARLVAATT